MNIQFKLQEPILLLGKDRFSEVDIRIRVKGGGRISQIYAIRQALSKSLVAYYQKCKLFLFKINHEMGSFSQCGPFGKIDLIYHLRSNTEFR